MCFSSFCFEIKQAPVAFEFCQGHVHALFAFNTQNVLKRYECAGGLVCMFLWVSHTCRVFLFFTPSWRLSHSSVSWS